MRELSWAPGFDFTSAWTSHSPKNNYHSSKLFTQARAEGSICWTADFGLSCGCQTEKFVSHHWYPLSFHSLYLWVPSTSPQLIFVSQHLLPLGETLQVDLGAATLILPRKGKWFYRLTSSSWEQNLSWNSYVLTISASCAHAMAAVRYWNHLWQ